MAGALLAVSLLAVFEAPAYPLFLVAIAVTEYGHWFAPLALLPLLRGWEKTRGGGWGAVLGAAAFLLLLSPLTRAFWWSHDLDDRLRAAFGEAPPAERMEAPARPRPISRADLLFGVHSAPVERTTREYARPGGDALLLDLYHPPAGGGPRPAVLVVHGGSWRGGDRGDLPALSRYLAAHGYLVAAPDYRLAPRHPFPAAFEDVKSALAWLKANAVELGIDPGRIALLGRSAGGQLALLAAFTADPPVAGIVAFYAPNDLEYAWANPTNPLVLDSRRVLGDYLGGGPEEVPGAYRAASPLGFVGPKTPPTLSIHGMRDEMVRPAHSRRLEAAMAAAGRPHLALLLPWATHGCDYNLSGPCGQVSTYAIERFLAAVTRLPAVAPRTP